MDLLRVRVRGILFKCVAIRSEKRTPAEYSNEYLQKWSREHLHYEINQLTECVTVLPSTNPKSFEMDLATVSMCVHWRNLIEFLYTSPRPQEDDICAFHFLNKRKRWEKARGAKPKRVKELQERVHKETVHLTTKRYSELEQKEWKYVELVELLINPLQEFLERADSAKLSTNVNDAAQRLFNWRINVTGRTLDAHS